MKVRGRRECKECGAGWSYFDTGEVSCPDCGSLHSVGVDSDRVLHTATPASLDLAPVRDRVDEEPLRRVAERAADAASEFTRGYGFVDTGELQSLDDTYLAATELRHVAGELARRIDVTDAEERYLVSLLRADEGTRPDIGDVPDSARAMRGLAYANAVEAYRSDLRTYLEERPDEAARSALGRLYEHVKRVQALDGDVPPCEAERLVATARDVGRYLVDGSEADLATARQRLDDST